MNPAAKRELRNRGKALTRCGTETTRRSGDRLGKQGHRRKPTKAEKQRQRLAKKISKQFREGYPI